MTKDKHKFGEMTEEEYKRDRARFLRDAWCIAFAIILSQSILWVTSGWPELEKMNSFGTVYGVWTGNLHLDEGTIIFSHITALALLASIGLMLIGIHGFLSRFDEPKEQKQ